MKAANPLSPLKYVQISETTSHCRFVDEVGNSFLVDVLEPTLLRVRYWPASSPNPSERVFFAAPGRFRSAPLAVKSAATKERTSITIVDTGALRLEVRDAPSINFRWFVGTEKDAFALDLPNGFAASAETVSHLMSRTPTEKYYGFEEKNENNTEMKFKSVNGETPKLVPLYVTLKDRAGRPAVAYGFFYDTKGSSELSVGNEINFTSNGGDLDYYFIMGPHVDSVTSQWAKLTGRTPSPPIPLSVPALPNPSS